MELKNVANELEDISVQKERAEKLPGVGLINPAVTQPEILGDESRLVGLQHQLGEEDRKINTDQRKHDGARPRTPARRMRRSFSTGKTHAQNYRKRFGLSLGISKARCQSGGTGAVPSVFLNLGRHKGRPSSESA